MSERGQRYIVPYLVAISQEMKWSWRVTGECTKISLIRWPLLVCAAIYVGGEPGCIFGLIRWYEYQHLSYRSESNMSFWCNTDTDISPGYLIWTKQNIKNSTSESVNLDLNHDLLNARRLGKGTTERSEIHVQRHWSILNSRHVLYYVWKGYVVKHNYVNYDISSSCARTIYI